MNNELLFGDGKILVLPFVDSDGIVGIALSTKMGQGEINEKKFDMSPGSLVVIDDCDVVLRFKNIESLKVLQWAIDSTMQEFNISDCYQI